MVIKPKRSYVGRPERILILRPGALGDTLMVLPALCGLPEECSVTFVGRQPGLYFVSARVSRAADMESGGWHRLFFTNSAAAASGGNSMFMEGGLGPAQVLEDNDSVVVFLKDPDGGLKKNLKKFAPGSRIHVFPGLPPEGSKIHVAYYIARCLEKAGLKIDPERCLDKALRESLVPGVFKDPQGAASLVLHPGSGSRAKNYPPEFWIRLVEEITRCGFEGRLRPCMLIGPAELGMVGFLEAVKTEDMAEIVVIEDKQKLHRLLSGTSFYVGHDSGVTHLAALMGINTVALFRKTDEALWRPLGPKVHVIKEMHNTADLLAEICKLLSCNLGSARLYF